MNNPWLVISIGAILLFIMLILYFRKSDKNKIKAALTVGILLTVFDFILENIGKITGFWESFHGSVYIAYVPIEIFIICFFGGVMWSLILPSKRDDKFSVLFILLSIISATFLESKLVDIGLFGYGNGWTTFHALVAYSIIIFLMHETFYFSYAKFSKDKFNWLSPP